MPSSGTIERLLRWLLFVAVVFGLMNLSASTIATHSLAVDAHKAVEDEQAIGELQKRLALDEQALQLEQSARRTLAREEQKRLELQKDLVDELDDTRAREGMPDWKSKVNMDGL